MTSGMLAYGFHNVTGSIHFLAVFVVVLFYFLAVFEGWWPPRLKTHITSNVGETKYVFCERIRIFISFFFFFLV